MNSKLGFMSKNENRLCLLKHWIINLQHCMNVLIANHLKSGWWADKQTFSAFMQNLWEIHSAIDSLGFKQVYANCQHSHVSTGFS